MKYLIISALLSISVTASAQTVWVPQPFSQDEFNQRNAQQAQQWQQLQQQQIQQQQLQEMQRLNQQMQQLQLNKGYNKW